MTKVILHGQLGKKFGREYDLSINSPIEGIRALSALKPGFREYFAEGNYYLYTGDKEKEYLTEETVRLRTTDTIHIVPAAAGAKKKGVGKLIAGIALIGISFIPGLNAAVFGALGGVAGTSAGASSALASAFSAVTTAKQLTFMAGLSLALGGAAQLTAPKVGEQRSSTLFGGTPDSVEEGTPVSLVYGRYLAIGYPVSFEITNGFNNYSGYGGSVGGGGAGGGTGGWDTIRVDQV